MEIRPVRFENDRLILIDQRKLPGELVYVQCKTHEEVEFAIRDMIVRGAPAIGGTAAYGIVVAANQYRNLSKEDFLVKMGEACDLIRKARPTAVNLMWAVDKMRKLLFQNRELEITKIYGILLEQARKIDSEDVQGNKKIGMYGNSLIPEGATILTHCNAGALATMGYGTALGVIRAAHDAGKNIFVYSDETRPRFQGARLTAWELMEEGIPCKTIFDSVAATLIRDGKIDAIVVGADRIAVNGDAANKIGTFMLSVVAKVYNVPFYVAAPMSTFDFSIESGEEIAIEERNTEEVSLVNGGRIVPEGMDIYNPGFDVTPHENITAIITDRGVIKAPFRENILQIKNVLDGEDE